MYKIIMSGIVSEKSILILKSGLKNEYNQALALDFFCLYSEHNIPVGSNFTSFINRKTGLSVKVNATIIDVTQQWGKPFDVIPTGYRTLARVEFSEQDNVTLIRKEMPVIDRWEDSNYDFILSE